MSLIPFVGALQKFNRQRGGYQIERSLRSNGTYAGGTDYMQRQNTLVQHKLQKPSYSLI